MVQLEGHCEEKIIEKTLENEKTPERE